MFSTKPTGVIMIVKTRNAVLGIVAAAAFAVLMMLNVTPTENGLAISLSGETVMASDPGDLQCQQEPSELYYNNSDVRDLRNCDLSGSGYITCTVPAP
jgi:hypothetical protein